MRTPCLQQLAEDFAAGMVAADDGEPVAVNKRSGKPFQPGIGPHAESEVIDLVGAELLRIEPDQYEGRWHTDVPYPSDGRRRCDLCLGEPGRWEWAIEVKMLRFLGDNGRVNDNILMHILSPYAADRSALSDCEKITRSDLAGQKAVMIFGYDHAEWPLDPAIDAFENLAEGRVVLGPRAEASFEGLIHPVHQEGRVFAWSVAEEAREWS